MFNIQSIGATPNSLPEITSLTGHLGRFLARSELTPSSDFVVSRVTAAIDRRAKTVIELGAGTGVITQGILDTLSPNAKLLSIELDPNQVAKIREQNLDRRLVVAQGDARHLTSLTRGTEFDAPDCIVSSIPLFWFSIHDRNRLLKTIANVLKPGGKFVCVQHCWLTLRELSKISDTMQIVSSKIAWWNLPPLRVSVAQKRSSHLLRGYF